MMEVNIWWLITYGTVMIAWTLIMGFIIQPILVNRRLFRLIQSGKMSDIIAVYIERVLREDVKIKDSDGKTHNVRLFDLILHSSFEYMKTQLELMIQSNKGHIGKKMKEPGAMLEMMNQFLPEKYQGIQYIIQHLVQQGQSTEGAPAGSEQGTQAVKYL